MATTRYTRSRSRDTALPPSSSQQQQLTPRGNLESVLKKYNNTKMEDDDQNTRLMISSLTPPQSTNEQQHDSETYNQTAAQQQNEQHLLSVTTAAINIPAELNSANTVNSANISDDTDDDRERSITLGSEFDIIMKDGRGMSISDYYNNNNNNNNNSTRLRGNSTASASNFLNGLFDQSFINVPEVVSSSQEQQQEEGEQEEHHQQQYEQSLSISQLPPIGGGQSNNMKNDNNIKKMMISHTPPIQFGNNSYENSHFSKRMRSGSISGRLRSMSDLEESGAISREQKTILKDLVIAGDDAVQDAIDKYEAGDVTVLEDMIKGGYLLSKSSADVDLLGDLDLDFLNVGGGVVGGDNLMEEDGNSESDGDIGGTNTMMFGTIDDLMGSIPSSVGSSMVGKLMTTSITSTASDDLEFGGLSVLSSSNNCNSNYNNYGRTRGESVDDIDLHHRMRANSLAVPGMHLPGVGTTDDISQISFNRWMDTSVAERRECELLLGLKQGDEELGLEGKKKKKTKKTEKGGTKKSSLSTSSPTKKEKKGPNPNRERKSQSKMKDMMEGMSSSSSSSGDNNKSPLSKKGDDCNEESDEVPSGLGLPRSMSDPNLSVRLDSFGLLRVNGPDGWVGAYSPDSRHLRVTRFLEKRQHRIWCKKVKYDVRKSFADSRLRVKGRFVKKEDEMLMRELMSLT